MSLSKSVFLRTQIPALSFREKRGTCFRRKRPDSFSSCVSTHFRAVHHAAQKNVAHLAREPLRVSIDPRIVPSIDPVHHAKQAENRDPRGNLQSPLTFQFIQQSH